jgi:formyl-CoA transferase
LASEIQAIFHTKTLDEWMDVALKYDIAMGPANLIPDLLSDKHLQSREIIYDSVHPHAGPFKTVGWPAPVAGQPFGIEHEAPLVGEQSDEVLEELGYSDDEVRRLRERGVL